MDNRTRARLLAVVCSSLLLGGGAPLVGLVLGGPAATAIYRRVPG
jgi:hypothetical protein